MEIDWKSVEKILIVRLRSIGDTVLATPTLLALREFLPKAKIDIVLEDWVAPVLEGFEAVDEVVTVSKSSLERLRLARRLRSSKYDVAINLHGGPTAGFLTLSTGARYRIGYKGYQYSFLYNRRYPPASEFWKKEKTHSAEQQIALIGFGGIRIEDCPKTSLTVIPEARKTVDGKLGSVLKGREQRPVALIHPGAAYETKRWAGPKFAVIVEYLETLEFIPVVLTTPSERPIADLIENALGRQINALSDLSLPEVTALASKASIFVGNDSGIAHIAAAVGTPSVVIFGSSNRAHWRPWTDARNEVVHVTLDCQPCPGDKCRVFGEPRCILSVSPEQVIESIDRIVDGKAR